MTNRSPYSGFYVTTVNGYYVSGPWQTGADADAEANRREAEDDEVYRVTDPESVIDLPDLDYEAREAARDREEDQLVEEFIDERRGLHQ